jgi:hypothetical protein
VEYALFERLILDNVMVEAGATTSLKARLRIGRVDTAVTVTPESDAATNLDVLSAAAVASTVTAAEMNLLPLNGRRWQSFALLTPTANADPEGDRLLSFRGEAPHRTAAGSTAKTMTRASAQCHAGPGAIAEPR